MSQKRTVETSSLPAPEPQPMKPLTPSKRRWFEERLRKSPPGSKAYKMAYEVLKQDDALKQKGLHLKSLQYRVTEVKPDIDEPSSVPVIPSKIENRDDLETLINFRQFKHLIRETEDIKVLQLADAFAEEVRQIIQEQIKRKLWGENPPAGNVSFSSFVQDDSRAYLKASVRGSSRLVGTLDGEEKERALQEHREREQQKRFQNLVKKDPAKKSAART